MEEGVVMKNDEEEEKVPREEEDATSRGISRSPEEVDVLLR